MSDENSSEDVTEKVKALEKEYAALRAALTRSRFTRLIIFLGAVGLVAVIGWMFYSFAIDVTSSDYQEKLLSMAKERLEKNKDDYLKQVQKLVDHSAPKLKDAFYNQTKKDMPKYTAAFGAQRDEFRDNIKAELDKQIRAHYQGTLDKYKDKLAEEFPELSTPELRDKAMDQVDKAFKNLVDVYYVDALAEGLDEIYGSWDDFPVGTASDGTKPEDVLIGLMLELVSKKMAN